MGAGCTKLALCAYEGVGWHESVCAAQAARIANKDGWLPLHLQPNTTQATMWYSSCWLHILRCRMSAGCTKLALYALGEVTTAWVIDISAGHRRVLCIRCHARGILDT